MEGVTISSSLKCLSNDQLLRAYDKAVENKLDELFIRLLSEEIEKRGLIEKTMS